MSILVSDISYETELELLNHITPEGVYSLSNESYS